MDLNLDDKTPEIYTPNVPSMRISEKCQYKNQKISN